MSSAYAGDGSPSSARRQIEEPPRRGLIIAFLIGGFVLVGISIFANSVQNAPAAVAPRVTMIGGSSQSAANPAVLRFTTEPRLEVVNSVWAAGNMHPHVLVDGAMTMPMGDDITLVGDTALLHMRQLAQGTHSVSLFWADAGHLPIGDSTHVDLTIVR